MWLSFVLIAVIVVVFTSIVICGIRNKIKGKTSCSCGGNCNACHLCHVNEDKN